MKRLTSLLPSSFFPLPCLRPPIARHTAALLLAITLTACATPAWYAQAVDGQLDLMRGRQDIDAFLAAAGSEDPLAARLATAREILAFADEQLDLPAGDAYASLVITGRRAVTWNVVATPELSLAPKRWCHVVGGCLPYLGWFDGTAAQAYAGRLAEDGMDTAVSPVTAYSTLGWFEDPLTDIMLSRSDAALAATLIHELAHRRLFARSDADFSESYATFLERIGTRAWLLASGREPAAAQWLERQAAMDQFNELLLRARRQLQGIYAETASDDEKRRAKQRVFQQLRTRYDTLASDEWGGRGWFDGFFDPPPNNADLALAGSYLGGLCAFRSLFDRVGRDFGRFNAEADRLARSGRDVRADFLSTPRSDDAGYLHCTDLSFVPPYRGFSPQGFE